MLGTATVTSCKFGAWAILVCAFLFAADVWETSPGVVGFIFREVAGVLDDPRTQWVIFAFFGIYFATFLILRRRAHSKVMTAANALQLAQQDGACFWLIVALGVCAINYTAHYSPSTQALMFIGGALLGQGIMAWAGFELKHQKPELRNHLWFSTLSILIILLAVASLWRGDTDHDFAYQGRARLTGPWGNPNIFGLLMAAGVLLATGQIIQCLKPLIQSQEKGWQRLQLNAGNGVIAVLCLLAAIPMVRGLYFSYSRGAWLGTLCGLAYLTGRWLWRLDSGRGGESGAKKNQGSRLIKNWLPAFVVMVSLVVVCFWHFRQTNWHPARRAFSAVNAVDFSWRNRVAAWEGALQITAEHPWLGAGWNQPEPLYEHYYLPAKLTESLAIQMNDYLLFCATLGLPALFCFGMYLWLSLTWKSKAADHDPEAGRRSWQTHPPARSLGGWNFDALQATCRAGAIVLLVGFCFDGGMFKLPTAAMFWILLEMGGLGHHPLGSLAKSGVNLIILNQKCERAPGTPRRLRTLHRALPIARSGNRHSIATPVARRGASQRVRREHVVVQGEYRQPDSPVSLEHA